MFECWWQSEGFEAWRLRGDLRGASRRWQHRLHDELWLWFNDSGDGIVWGKDHRIFLKPGLFGCFGGQEGEDWKWTRLPGHHAAEILIVPREPLLRLLGDAASTKQTPFARWLRGEQGVSFAGLMGTAEKRLSRRMAGGWKSRTLPMTLERELVSWFTRRLGLVPAEKARGRNRSLPHPAAESGATVCEPPKSVC